MSKFADNEYLFTSESVTEGHPDKVADQISDGVLDAVMRDDPTGRVACETLVNTGLVVVSGEISTETYVDIQQIARDTIRGIGYIDADLGFSADSCAVLNAIDKQSPDIAQGVDRSYETQSDPVGRRRARRRRRRRPGDDVRLRDQRDARRSCRCRSRSRTSSPSGLPRSATTARSGYLRPDGKTQVSVRYRDGRPVAIEKLLISTQHADSATRQQILDDLWETVVVPILPARPVRRERAAPGVPRQPDGPLRHRRPGRRLRPDGSQDHRRHLRRHGAPRRRRVQRQGPVEGRPLARRTPRAGSRRTSSPRGSRIAARCRSPTRSASRIRCR